MSVKKTAAAESTETVAEPTADKKAMQKHTEPVVYVGPTVPGVATRNTVFNNGLTQELKDAQDKEPAFKGLVVPVSSLATATNDIASKRGATYTFYERAAKYKA